MPMRYISLHWGQHSSHSIVLTTLGGTGHTYPLSNGQRIGIELADRRLGHPVHLPRADFSFDLVVLRLADIQATDNNRHYTDRDGIDKARVDRVRAKGALGPGRGCYGRGNEGQEAAKPAVAKMVGHRHRGIANLRGKELDQERRDGAIDRK